MSSNCVFRPLTALANAEKHFLRVNRSHSEERRLRHQKRRRRYAIFAVDGDPPGWSRLDARRSAEGEGDFLFYFPKQATEKTSVRETKPA